ncbi:response regulator [Seohaeicola nanhaiensis]|uniref:histidine kinase n=1 Tax=Seohaeicola nanhaiensis TaxID=1387282 RepID=A0ABV9KK31_9RHOB
MSRAQMTGSGMALPSKEDLAENLAAPLAIVVRVLAILVIAGALVILALGWMLGIEPVVRLRDDYPAMVPETAMTLVLGGIGLMLIQSPQHELLARGPGVLMLVVAAHGFISVGNAQPFDPHDGMSVATALSAVLAAASLILWDRERNGALRAVRITLESFGLVLVMVPLIGYAMNAEALFANPIYTKMALTTVLGFGCLFTGLLLSDPGHGWVQIVLAPDPGSQLLRKMLPFLVLVPAVFGLAMARSFDLSSDNVFRLSLLTFFAMVSTAMSAVFFTRYTNLSEKRAARAGGVLRESEQARHAAEIALSRSQRVEALGKLVGGVAHDFNNSLMVIMGNLELIEADKDETARRAYVAEAISASRQAAHLTRQLLAYGRKSRLEALPNVLDDLTSLTITMFRRICPADIVIHTDLDAARAVVLVDGANFQQALLNVLINARDAMPNGGEVFVSTRTSYLAAPALSGYCDDGTMGPGTFVKLAVRDTGVGMDPATLARAEEPFFTTKPAGEGSGLGLSAVSGFCRQSGGGLRMASEPGVGTTVTMAFPRSSELATGVSAQPPAIAEPVPMARILIVDDEPSVTRVMARQLQLDGHLVRVAQSADQALTILEVEPLPELIITDLIMPGTIQGHQLVEIILEKYPGAKVLLMSGYESERRRKELARVPPLAFLQKPIDRATLRIAVARALGIK